MFEELIPLYAAIFAVEHRRQRISAAIGARASDSI